LLKLRVNEKDFSSYKKTYDSVVGVIVCIGVINMVYNLPVHEIEGFHNGNVGIDKKIVECGNGRYAVHREHCHKQWG
ncbi:hypothetical protein, partial [Paenibacillus polymyxa]|uniref:hypothetical protein n=1 Tax=Paenibacillus polymyxa TaxID=1406 RepID=UPI0006C36B21